MYATLGRRILTLNRIRWESVKSSRMFSAKSDSDYTYKTLAVSNPSEYVYHVEINRPDKLNAMNKDMWREIGECFSSLGQDSSCRAIVLSGRGKLFTAGIDLTDYMEMASVITSEMDVARKCRLLKETISNYQDYLSSLEKCPKPVIAAVHNACIGGGIDLICSADIRYCTTDAWFQVKEVDVGIAADVGTLQRLPKVIGSESLVRDLCFTARKFFSSEAERVGFVSRVLPNKEDLTRVSLELASKIAEKSPVAVQATKQALIHARDHSVQEGLDYMANVNMTLLQSEDVMKAAAASLNRKKATFSKL